MDYYNILQVAPDATLSEIKDSYRKLVVKYHPDKNNNSDSHAKFIDINTAYQVLSDDNRRSEYDRLNIYQRGQLYDLLKYSLEHFDFFSENKDLFKSIVEYYYGNENDFRKDVNNFNFKNIYNRFYANYYNIWNSEINDTDIPLYNKDIASVDVNNYDKDIYGIIYTNLSDRYSNKYKKLKVTRQSDNTTETFIVPLIMSNIIIPQKGEKILSNEKYGDIIIKIICEEHPEYTQINDTDIVTIKYITLYQYLYGGDINLILPDNNELNVTFDSFINKTPIICLSNKGLPILDNNDEIIKTNGNLYIYFKIKEIDTDIMKQQVKNIS